MRVTAKYGAYNVRVFGSVAPGERGQESDLDLLVRFDRGVTLLHRAALIRELEALLESKVDVVSDKGLRPKLRERVLAEATPL